MASRSPDAAAAGATVLVTGAHGFIGRAVVAELHSLGARPVCPYRPDTPPHPALPGTPVPLDLLDARAVEAAMGGVELVVHLAARSGGIQFQQADPVDVLRANTAMTANVLRAAQRAGVRRVFLASSAVVYSAGAGERIGEDDDLVAPHRDAVSGYAWSKVTDEVLGGWSAASGGPEVVVGRFSNVYGPGGSFDPERSTVVHALVRRAVEAPAGGCLEVWGDGSAVRSFVHVADAARAVIAVLGRGLAGEAYNIDSSEPVTIRELATIVRDAAAPGLTLEFNTDRPQGPPRRVLDTAKLRALGFTPQVRLTDGVAATVDAYRAQVAR
jgi:nucleoside-diphosphate-sugar epimerase